jgi:Xaa-Pro aminopeptidase
MADGLLLYGDSLRDSDIFLASGVSIGDPFAFIESDGRKVLLTSVLEVDMARERSRATEVWTTDDFGIRDLVREGMDREDAEHEVVRRALERLGVDSATVPPTFPLGLADSLRSAGVALTPARGPFDERRRRKDADAVAGIRAAQAATEEAFARLAEMLQAAERGEGGVLVLDGEPVTSERLRAEIEDVLRARGCDTSSDPPIVSHGPQAARGHELGSGPVLSGEPLVVDVFPRHAASRFHTDMTRTFCVGEPPADLVHWHEVVLEALRASTAAIRPGVTGRAVYDVAADVIEGAGFRTQRTLGPGESLDEDFFHGLGHGVGIDVHEAPGLGISGRDELVPGDVVTVEPGLYRKDLGGVRLEDIVLVTDDGHEVLTRFPYDLAP